ncbi:MAG: methylated-DNA--[Lachnospiraceae bacterium]|nr:methylated-DNA--[protein]-cysteine S-methyltransferase [Lachnospiraceae bacterium]
MKHKCYMKTPVGVLCIEEEDDAITALYLDKCSEITKDSAEAEPETELLKKAVCELSEYFRGKRKEFDLPLMPQGTEFQKRVWEALRTIPCGETRSYGEIAAQIGNPKACRAVGGANHKNPILILIPCHRVVGADGSLTGFACGTEAKEYLLKLEKIIEKA